jgi:hypothetical protein
MELTLALLANAAFPAWRVPRILVTSPCETASRVITGPKAAVPETGELKDVIARSLIAQHYELRANRSLLRPRSRLRGETTGVRAIGRTPSWAPEGLGCTLRISALISKLLPELKLIMQLDSRLSRILGKLAVADSSAQKVPRAFFELGGNHWLVWLERATNLGTRLRSRTRASHCIRCLFANTRWPLYECDSPDV